MTSGGFSPNFPLFALIQDCPDDEEDITLFIICWTMVNMMITMVSTMMVTTMMMKMMVGIDHPLRPCAAYECKWGACPPTPILAFRQNWAKKPGVLRGQRRALMGPNMNINLGSCHRTLPVHLRTLDYITSVQIESYYALSHRIAFIEFDLIALHRQPQQELLMLRCTSTKPKFPVSPVSHVCNNAFWGPDIACQKCAIIWQKTASEMHIATGIFS